MLGKFGVIMADPPWEIHQDLPYGTMADEEMRRMGLGQLQDEGVIFLWVTGAGLRTLETLNPKEMRRMGLGRLQDEGVVFLWVTGAGFWMSETLNPYILHQRRQAGLAESLDRADWAQGPLQDAGNNGPLATGCMQSGGPC